MLFIAAIGVIAALFVCVVVVSVLRSRTRVMPPPPMPVVPTPPSEVRVKILKSKTQPVAHAAGVATSAAVVVVCGDDPATADRYEARNDALRSIARRRDLARNDVALLMAYVGATNDVLRAERTAALKNDVLNLLLLESMRAKGGLRLRPAVDAAVRRIKERGGGK